MATQGGGAFPGPTPRGRKGDIAPTPPLPIEGAVEIDLPVERIWEVFCDVRAWPRWNPCIWRARVSGGRELRPGARIMLWFNPMKPLYLYRLPGRVEIVELEPYERVSWEGRAPGLHVLHSYRFAPLGADRCRFGSWEVAEGRFYRAARRFWLSHFRYVCRSSLEGARALGAQPHGAGRPDLLR